MHILAVNENKICAPVKDGELAPGPGFEPGTTRLTAGRSTWLSYPGVIQIIFGL